MNEFLLVIHRDLTSEDARPSPYEMKMATKPYQEWIAGIAARNKLVVPPKRWDSDGRFIKSGNAVANGPYTSGKTSVAGMFMIRANDYEEAIEIARACPIIQYGAVVEVRMAMMPAQ